MIFVSLPTLPNLPHKYWLERWQQVPRHTSGYHRETEDPHWIANITTFMENQNIQV